jgi:alginate O-acetyltransferase complex protein AlgI
MDFLTKIFTYNEQSPMLFTGIGFWLFFAILLLFYSIIYKKNTIRNGYLFLMSLFFYYKSGGYFFSLLIFSTLADYWLGKMIYQSEYKWEKKFFVTISIVVNLGLLAYFKYTYFFTDIINQIFNTNFEVINFLALWTNSATGSSFDISTIILPVGISFYTFQTISYSVDVYRGKIEPVKNIIDFGFYVSFFPQLVAGPIVRAAEFVPQLYKKYSVSKEEFSIALFLILNGLIKKMLISDYLSINFVDRVFNNPAAYTGFENMMAVFGYSLQIYCDFSGYTDIAIGVALLLGFRLPLNFNSPYKAMNITDFWRRWHISLSSWLKDYLYITLGGNRKGKIRTYINLALTMLLGGLWHGAALRFIIWGGLHGAALAIHKIWMEFRGADKKQMRKSNPFTHFATVLFTFLFVSFTWIFFRADSMDTAFFMIEKIFTSQSLYLIPEIIHSYYVIFSLLIFGFVVHWLPVKTKGAYKKWFVESPLWLKGIIAVIVFFIIYQAKSSDIQPFIYFQF